MSRTHRALRRLRDLLNRRRPHGLLGPGYLYPGADPRVRLHRQLWWRHGEGHWRALWLLLEAWLWLRWVLVHAAPASWRAVRHYGEEIEQREGISRRTQAGRVLHLALRWCIAPEASYRYGLYRHPKRALDYVHAAERGAFHAWRNAGRGDVMAAREGLTDKARFAAALHPAGIPCVPTLALVSAGDGAAGQLIGLARSVPRLFCKANRGYRGLGAFTAWSTADGLAGRHLDGRPLADTQAVLAAWAGLLTRGSGLIQAALDNHPMLAALGQSDDAMTLRLLTDWPGPRASTPVVQYACLHVPAMSDIGAEMISLPLSIDAANGTPGFVFNLLAASPAVRDASRRIEECAAPLGTLPDWKRIISGSIHAHRQFPALRAIAWDWVITPSGPLLLEGNVDWDETAPQILLGGLLGTIARPLPDAPDTPPGAT